MVDVDPISKLTYLGTNTNCQRLVFIKIINRTRQMYETDLIWKNNAPIFPSCGGLPRRKRGAKIFALFQGNRGYRLFLHTPRTEVLCLPSLLRVQTFATLWTLPFFWDNTANMDDLHHQQQLLEGYI